MPYALKYISRAEKQLRKLPRHISGKILAELEKLAENPFASTLDVKKLSGREGYRLRIGDYRAIYEIHRKQVIILVIEVGHRKEIYA